MTRRPETTGFWRARLPHWEVEDGRYFVTIHLAGAIPQCGEDRIRQLAQQSAERASSPHCEDTLLIMRTVFREMESWLDRAGHSRLLEVPEVAEIVTEAIQHRIKSHVWNVFEYVILPNHIHLFLSVNSGTLKERIEDFNRWTGHRAAQLVDLPQGRFWQDEWFDHWSRSDEQDDRIIAYIQQNPVTAGFVRSYSDWPYGSWNQK